MRRYGHFIIVLLLLLGSVLNTRAQNSNNLVAARKKLILLIDLKTSKSDIDSILKRAGITDIKTQDIINGDFSSLTNNGWMLVKRINNVVQFDRKLDELKANPQLTPFLITANMIKSGNRNGYPDNILYGVNKFSLVSVHEQPSGLTRFFLPGFLNAKRVFLSGSFNDWSTLKGVMFKTATGWALDLKLQAGAYEYKFIVDGRWMTDPDNLIQLNDGGGNTNSFYYKYNYTFKLKGFPSAQRVALAGSFNNWNGDELYLEKKGDTWELPIYLHEGTHAYRFIVDGKWMPDPANPDKYADNDDNINSVLNIGETVYFNLKGYTDAKNVYVAGDFNKWKPNKISLKKSGDGWSVPVILPAGNYNYQFIVDGQWTLDPMNPYKAVEDGKTNSLLAVDPNHTFKIKGHDDTKTILLSGTFNDWSQGGYTMGHNDDEWSISLYLKPGKYLYKFIVDGNWILDPANKLWEQNAENTGNSVLWMEP